VTFLCGNAQRTLKIKNAKAKFFFTMLCEHGFNSLPDHTQKPREYSRGFALYRDAHNTHPTLP